MRTTDSDSDLVARAREGDTAAFGRLVRRYQDAVYGLAYYQLGNFHDAQDVAQEAFIRAYLHLHQLQDASRFVGWLRSLTINLCRDWVRRRRSRMAAEASASQVYVDREEQADIRRTVQRALNALPDEHRLATTLYYVDGYSYREIGDFLGVPATTVKGRIQRARRQLRKEMIAMVEELFEAHRLPEGFAEVVVERVGKDYSTVLVRDEEHRGVYLEVGVYAGHAIGMKLEGKTPPRPMGHDFFKRVMDAFEIKFSDVLVERAKDGGYSATLMMARGRKQGTFNAPPGDGLALAIRCGAAVHVSADIAKAAMPVPKAELVGEVKQSGYVEAPPIQIGEHVLVTVKEKPEAPPDATPKWDARDRARQVKRRTLSDDSDLIPLGVESVGIQQSERYPFVLMKGQSEKPYLVIGIGAAEAAAIATCLSEERIHCDALDMTFRAVWEQTRKQRSSYDVLKDVLDCFGIEMAKAVIDQLRESTFLAVDFFKRGRMVRKVDARPSDSINLAIRCGCPIFATQAVMEKAGVAAGTARYGKTRARVPIGEMKPIGHYCTVHVGDRVRFRVKGEKSVRWTSSDPSVGTVDKEATFTALKPGSTRIQVQ